MAERKTQVNIGKGPVDGFNVPINETTERWSEVSLSDGSVLRVKPNIVGVIRVEGQYDTEGNPIYAVQSAIAMTIVSVPAHLKKDATGTGKAN